MKRYAFSRYGAFREVIRLEEASLPVLHHNDVLVKISASGLNPIDLKIVKGYLRPIQRLALPASFGFDFCGRIEAVGPTVRNFKIGDRVFGRAPRDRMGAFAEYFAIDAALVAHAPELLTEVEAASLPLVALTTLQGLSLRAKASPGQSILIHAGSGGLGSFAVQYAKRTLGLNVTTTTSEKNREWVSSLGADLVIAYDRKNYLGRPARYDIVFDTIGGAATADAFKVIKRGGIVVSVAGPPDKMFARQVSARPLMSLVLSAVSLPMRIRAWLKGAHYYRFLTESSGPQLELIRAAVDRGDVRPIIDRVYPFEQLVPALETLSLGRAKGKIVISM